MSKIFDYALSQVPDDVKRFIDNSIEIANRIHSILERQGKTQRDLANLLGKKESEISKWLRGSHNFTVRSLSKIESVLNEKILVPAPKDGDVDFHTTMDAAGLVDITSDKKDDCVKREESMYAMAA